MFDSTGRDKVGFNRVGSEKLLGWLESSQRMSKISENGVDLRQAMQGLKVVLAVSKRHRPSHFDRRGELQAKSRQLLVLMVAQR